MSAGVLVTRLLGALGSAVMLFGPAAASSAAASPSSDSQLTVQVPYLGSASRSIPDGWTVTACPADAPPNQLDVTCSPGRVTFTGTGFSPDVGVQQVTVTSKLNGAPQSLTFSVALAAPALNGPRSGVYGFPLGKGQRTLIPFSDLPYSCAACGAVGPTFAKGAVSPPNAGSVGFTTVGVLFSPSPDFTGAAKLSFLVRDQFGTQAARTTIQLSVVGGATHAPTAITDSASVSPGQTATGDVLSNDVVDQRYPVVLSACGKPFNGSVVCKPDGSYVYTPSAGFAGVDQFSYHLFTQKTGDQVTGSVLVGVGVDPTAKLLDRPSSSAIPAAGPARIDRIASAKAGVLAALREALGKIAP